MPAATLRPVVPRHTTVPPVMYSQQWSPVPSTTASAILLRTAKRSPAPHFRCDLARWNPHASLTLPCLKASLCLWTYDVRKHLACILNPRVTDPVHQA